MYFERLDRMITLQTRSVTIDSVSNERVETWTDSATIWAQKKALQGSENFKADTEISVGNALWYIRYYPSLDSQTFRIKDEQSQIWDIVGEPREIGRREGWELSARRRADQ